ncbi:Nucleoporin NDC1 [Apophysomyces sp. BC1034]|nr:Nucleoporin NDC1 [Apophysomyces sp. BC1034]
MLGAGFAVKRIIERRTVVQLPAVKQPIHTELKTNVATLTYSALKWTLFVFKYIYIAFIFFHGTLYYGIANVLGSYTKILISPVIGFRWVDLYLFVRLIMAGWLATFCWEIMDRVFDVFFSMSYPAADPNTNYYDHLITGLQSNTNAMVQASAYCELAQLACKTSETRASLYTQTNKDLANSAWSRISNECLQVINGLRSVIEKEYNNTQKAQKALLSILAAAPVVAPKPTAAPAVNRIELVDMDVFATPKPAVTYLDDRTGSLFTNVSTLAEASNMSTPPISIVTENVTKKLSSPRITAFLKRVEVKAQKWHWVKEFYAETRVRKVRQVFNNLPILLWAIQALGSLTAASLKEDPYGYVQRDIGRVLDTFLGCLIEVQTYIKSPPEQYKKLVPGFHGKAVLNEPEAVVMALREAVYQIRVTFKDHLDGIAVQKKYTATWQRFVDFEE